MTVNPNPKGDLTQNFSGCNLDSDLMKYNPIRVKFYHYDNQTSLRKLLWHEDELQTNVIVFRPTVFSIQNNLFLSSLKKCLKALLQSLTRCKSICVVPL
jgi:uncharacterized protein with ParB-like and HNH nuclease domain